MFINYNGFLLNKKLPLLLLLLIISLPAVTQTIIPPEPYGGERLMKQFLQEEMVYPPPAIANGEEGNVDLSFTVGQDGIVSNIVVQKSVSPLVDKEAIRLLKLIQWYPAREIGIAVKANYELRIGFKIKRYEKWVKNRGYDAYSYPIEPVDSSFKVFKREDTDQYPRPVFSSLDLNLSHFISTHLTYPEAAFRANVSGTVHLRFVVEPSGRISNIRVIEGVGGGCTEEAIRVVKMIDWLPGLKDKMAVRTCIPIEITFDISKKTVGGNIPNPGQLQ